MKFISKLFKKPEPKWGNFRRGLQCNHCGHVETPNSRLNLQIESTVCQQCGASFTGGSLKSIRWLRTISAGFGSPAWHTYYGYEVRNPEGDNEIVIFGDS